MLVVWELSVRGIDNGVSVGVLAFPGSWEVEARAERERAVARKDEEEDEDEEDDEDGEDEPDEVPIAINTQHSEPHDESSAPAPAPSQAYKEFLQFLELGCFGSPVQGYPVIVIILSTIPSSVRPLPPLPTHLEY